MTSGTPLVPFLLTLVGGKNNFSFSPASLGVFLVCQGTYVNASLAEVLILMQPFSTHISVGHSGSHPRIELHWLRCLSLQRAPCQTATLIKDALQI